MSFFAELCHRGKIAPFLIGTLRNDLVRTVSKTLVCIVRTHIRFKQKSFASTNET